MAKKETILITGGAKRIGRALALALAKAGYAIALHYNSSQREAQKLAKTIKANKGRIHLFRCNLANEEDVLQLTQDVKKACPDYSVLINNASIFKPSKIADSSMKTFHDNMKINFQAPYILTKHFSRYCKKGCIINILDTNINRNNTAYADYLLSKKSLSALTHLSAAELAPRIRVNAIAPGLILAPEGKSQTYLHKRAEKIPLKRTGSLDSIVHAARFLIENDFITGETIYCDGGEHLT